MVKRKRREPVEQSAVWYGGAGFDEEASHETESQDTHQSDDW